MDLIKSRKTIANTLNLRGKPEKEKTHGEGRNFTMSMAITGRILWCARVSEFNKCSLPHWKGSTIYTSNVCLDKFVESPALFKHLRRLGLNIQV